MLNIEWQSGRYYGIWLTKSSVVSGSESALVMDQCTGITVPAGPANENASVRVSCMSMINHIKNSLACFPFAWKGAAEDLSSISMPLLPNSISHGLTRAFSVMIFQVKVSLQNDDDRQLASCGCSLPSSASHTAQECRLIEHRHSGATSAKYALWIQNFKMLSLRYLGGRHGQDFDQTQLIELDPPKMRLSLQTLGSPA